jgi:hypothetical protein
MLQDLMTALQSASGQISHAPEVQPTTARKKRAGQTDLLITTHVVLIQEASVSPHLAQTVLGNLVHLAPTDHLLTDLIQIGTHLTEEPAATTVQTVQHAPTLTVHGNLVHLAPTNLTQTEAHPTEEQEATTVQIVRLVQTQIVHGNLVLQDLIAQSVQVTHVVLHLVQTLASMTETATHSVRTASHAIAQGMRHSLALAIRTQTAKHSLRTRF